MTKFEITIDLVVTANDSDDVHAMLPSYGDVTVSGFWECKTLFDVTLTNTVEAETAEEATATIGDDMRKAFSDIDPDWNAIIFQDDVEKIQLFHGFMHKFDEVGYIDRDVDLNKEFKCRECGTKYAHSFCSDKDVAICRWCSGEEAEAGILE
jgi:hypothetical protein